MNLINRSLTKEIIGAETNEVTRFIAAPIIIELGNKLAFEIFIQPRFLRNWDFYRVK